MIDEQLEFLIAQYADGTLPESERTLVELRLQTDVDARAMLDEYRTLDATLKASMPFPVVNWERLADHLSEAVAEQRETRAATVLGRIGNWGRMAIAAAVTSRRPSFLPRYSEVRPTMSAALGTSGSARPV